MMDAIVQLIRNGLCCIKDLDWFRLTIPPLYDAEVTQYYLTPWLPSPLPEPLDQTTPLEVMISICQLYAFTSLSRSGWNMLMSSLGKFYRIDRLVKTRGPYKSHADRLVNASLVKEGKYAIRSMFIGLLVTLIGISFFWLAANSWHVTETDWLGGATALIHALTVAEICLLVLLYYMWIDAGEQWRKATRMANMATALDDTGLTAKDMGLPSFEALTGWLPFWDAGVLPYAPVPDPKEEALLMEKEVASVAQSLKDMVDSTTATRSKKHKHEEKVQELRVACRITRWEAGREYLYFVLNLVAFYGYMLSIIAYYFDNEETKHHTVKYMMFHLDSPAADWHGNFAGDLMWTIEPVVILTSPVLLSLMKPKPKRLKSD